MRWTMVDLNVVLFVFARVSGDLFRAGFVASRPPMAVSPSPQLLQ
jgi:hypothetical protein